MRVLLVESRSGTTTLPVQIAMDAADDLVVDLQVVRRTGLSGALSWTIGRIVAGGTVDIEVADSAVGTDRAPFTAYDIQDDVYQASGYGWTVAPTGRYSVHFYPDPAGLVFTDDVLIAFGTGLGIDLEPGRQNTIQVVVPDADEALAHLRSVGVEARGVEDLAWGRFVTFDDPDGNTWTLQQLPDYGAQG